MPRTIQKAPEQKLLLEGVDWQSYERLVRAFDERRIRITYDQGSLEIMTLSFRHERLKHLLGLLVVILAEELGLAIAGGGSLTMKRRQQKRGLEPDECFWLHNEAKMRGKTKFDLRSDPPPDLALEIDITRSSLDRMSLYAALGVPEAWRWKKRNLEVFLLDQEGKYSRSQSSKAFPSLRPSLLLDFLELAKTEGEVDMMRSFRAWIQKNLEKIKSR